MKDKTKEKNSGIGIKEKVKNYLKNKKAVAMILEYILTIECFAMLFLAITPGEVKAATTATDENGITWAYILYNGQATNLYYESGDLGETVRIPSMLGGYSVVSLYNSSCNGNIFSKSFDGTNTTVKKVIISNGLTSIGKNAFKGCSSLTEVEIPSSVTNIGSYAFYYCSSLTEIEIPSSVTNIGSYAFKGCSRLQEIVVSEENTVYSSQDSILYNKDKTILIECLETKQGKVIIPSSVTSIGEGAFYYCGRLTEIEIPEGVTTIGEAAFYYCSSLTEIEIPSSVTNIGSYAFYYCSSLTEIEIPSSVTNIGSYAFYYCSSLQEIVVSEENTVYSSQDGILYNKDKTSILQCPKDIQGEIVIPNSITTIGNSQFKGCKNLTGIELPNSLNYIGYDAFMDCSSLKNIIIPEGVTIIRESTFHECTSLKVIEIPSSVTEIENYAFNGINNGGISDIYIDNYKANVTIATDAWMGAKAAFRHWRDCTHTITKNIVESGIRIEEVSNNLEDGQIECRENYSFKILNDKDELITNKRVRVFDVVKTENVKPEDGIYTINNVNRNITIKVGIGNGEKVQAEDENGIIWNYTYQDGKATNVYYESGELGTTVTIPSTLDGYPVESICNNGGGSGRNIFVKNNWSSNSTIEEVIIPEGVTGIGDYAFYNCSGLININIPEEVTSIGNNAFSGCSSLTEVEIPSSVTSIGNWTFSSCYNLTDIYVDNEEENISGYYWSGESYVHYRNCKHKITIYNDPREGVEIEEVSNNLEEGKIECGETYEFRLVNEEGEVVKNKEIKIKKQGQFKYSDETTEVLGPNEEGVYIIENIIRDTTIIIGAENGETKQVTDENGITWEYRYDGGKARALKYISGSIPETLEIPAKIDGLVVTTMADEALKGQEVTNVILPDSIINIGQSAFEGCETLETIVLPEGLQQISSAAFKGCNNLQQVELPDRLTVIGNETFSGCTNLKIELKKGLVAIGKESFKGCEGITGKLILPETLVQIGEEAFSGCTGITKLEILAYTGTEKIDESYIVASNPRPWEEGISYDLSEICVTTIYDTGIIANNEVRRVVKDRWGNNVVENVTIIQRNINIGKNAFSGCSSLTEVRIPAGTSQVDSSVLDGCDNLTDIYIQMKKKDMLEEIEAPEGVRVHYLDCEHEIEIDKIEEAEVEVISGVNEEGKAICQGNYKFKVSIEEGTGIKGVVVKVGNKGEEKEAIKPDEEGIYTIKNVTKDKEVSITEGRIVEIRYEDKEGKQIAESTILVGEEGESYKAERKEIENYKAVGNEPANAEGIYGEEEIVVTYVYEKIPSGTITIKYEDKEGNQIIDPDTIQGYIGDSYEIARKNIKGYKAYGVTPEKAKGTYTKEDIEITFVYEEIKEGATVIKYVDEEGNYIARDKTIQEGQEVEKEELEAKKIDGYEVVKKEESKIKNEEIETEGEEKVAKEDGKEITYTYGENKTKGKTKKWTTEKTLLVIGGIVAGLILIFIIIAKREKEVEMKGKKYKNIEDAIEDIEEDDEEIEIKLLKNIEREEKIEGLEDERITINYNEYEIKIKK